MSKPTIVWRLAADLHRLLQRELARPHYDEENVAWGLLLILSREPYRSELLFRDYDLTSADLWVTTAGDDQDPDAQDAAADAPAPGHADRVFKPAESYLAQVLCRRLTLANNLMDRPTNMHTLLGLLAAHGPTGQGWSKVQVARAAIPPATALAPPYFARIARTLAAQVRRLTQYGGISARRRADYGPIWLTIPGCAAELAEELTLWDCLAALPVPVERDLDEASQHQLVRVLESLNEKYGLLRSCGLDPDQWHEAPGLSVDRLKKLHSLRKQAITLLVRAPNGGAVAPETAYAKAFEALQTDGKPLAGFCDFNDFVRSPVGEQMIHRGPRSLEEPIRISDDDTLPFGSTIAAADHDPDPDTGQGRTGPECEADQLAGLAYVIEQCPGIRGNPVLDWFARATLLAGRPVHGAGGVLANTSFRQLLATSKRYATLDEDDLLTALEQDLSAAVREGLNRSGQA